MKTLTKTGLLITIAMLAATFVQAQDYVLKTTKATIQGTSSLHDWESVITKLTCKINLVIENNTLQNIKSAEITIPVTGIKSEKGKIMDNKTYDAFNAEKNPDITFTLGSIQLTQLAGGKTSFEAGGYLKMAGTVKPVKLTGSIVMLANGEAELLVTKKIKMTEFNMKQPTAMMGAITVGDEVTVSFTLTLAPSPANQQAKR